MGRFFSIEILMDFLLFTTGQENRPLVSLKELFRYGGKQNNLALQLVVKFRKLVRFVRFVRI